MIEEGFQANHMRVNDSNLNAVTTGAQHTQRSGPAGGGRDSNASATGDRHSDQVQLSKLSSSLRALSGVDSEREARVTRLAASVESGSYSVESRRVSRQIVHDALQPR